METRSDIRPQLRILLVVDSYFPGNGGTEAQAQLLAELLVARGHQVKVLAPHLDARRPLQEKIRGISVQRLTYPKIRQLGALYLLVKFATWLIRNRRRFDAVHIHMAKNLAAGAGLVQFWLGIPVMVKVSGAWEFEGGVLDPRMQRNVVTAWLNKCIKKVAFMQAISEKTRDKLLAAGYPPERIQMIPNAVNVDLFDAAPRRVARHPGVGTVMYVGRLQPVKGVAVLVEAWRLVTDKTAARLVIVGDGPMRAELELMAANLGVQGSIDFVGRSTDVPRLLKQADIYVQPSFQEGLPNSVLEAMTAGLPIVATRVSGNEDLVIDGVNGRLVGAGRASDMANALIELINEPTIAAQMGKASRCVIEERYHSSRVLGLLEQAYSGVRARDQSAIKEQGRS